MKQNFPEIIKFLCVVDSGISYSFSFFFLSYFLHLSLFLMLVMIHQISFTIY